MITFNNRTIAIPAILLLLVACNAESIPEQPGPKVTQGLSEDIIFSPEKNTICDREGGFCVDDWGVALDITRDYLGQAAEEKYLEYIGVDGFQKFDGTNFTFSTGVYCDIRELMCLESKDSDKVAQNYAAVLYQGIDPEPEIPDRGKEQGRMGKAPSSMPADEIPSVSPPVPGETETADSTPE
jgi:hypothetical protein